MYNRRQVLSALSALAAYKCGTSLTSAQSLDPQLPSPEEPPAAPAEPVEAAPLTKATVPPGDSVRQRDNRIRLRDGRWLSYREYGTPSGKMVFYFHGTPGSRLELDICDQEVKGSGVRVIAIDRPGIGRSSYYCGRRITHWPSDVEQLADALGLGGSQFGIVGLSGGAPYATVCAARIPHRLTHVAIVSGHTPLSAPVCSGKEDKFIGVVAKRPRLGRFAISLSDRRLERKPHKMVKSVSKDWSAEDRKLVLCNPQRYRELLQNLNETLRCGPDGLTRDVQLLGSNWGFCLSEIQGVPVSIWQGGCDKIVTPSMARYFHRQIAGSELTMDPRAGHITMFKWHADEILSRFV